MEFGYWLLFVIIVISVVVICCIFSYNVSMRIAIVGPVGSGKSTQAKKLSQELHIPLIQTGELVRKKAQEDSDEGRRINEQMRQGHLIDDDLIAQLLQQELEEHHYRNYLADSYPRRLSQLNVFNPQIDKVIYLDVPDDELEKRLLKRHRIDDTPEVIEHRIQVYHTETVPLLEYYRRSGKLITIDASGSIEDVSRIIKHHLQELQS